MATDVQTMEAERAYRDAMDRLVSALRAFGLLTEPVSDATLHWLDETISRAEAVGFLYVAGLEYPAANRRLDDQRKLLRWVSDGRALLALLAERAE